MMTSSQLQTLCAALLTYGALAACGPTNTQEVGPTENENSLFTQSEIIGQIEYSAAGLTYLPSDLGPEEATWPHAWLSPGSGLWLVDPGSDLASWRLIRFDLRGMPVSEQPLAEPLALVQPNEFVPAALWASSGGRFSLVGSRRFDFDTGVAADFVLARFGPSGPTFPLISLPQYATDQALIAVDDRIFARSVTGPGQWRISVAGEPISQGPESSGATAIVHVGQHLLELVSQQELRILAGTGEGESLTISGGAVQGTIPVGGEGRIFGFIRLGPELADPSTEGVMIRQRTIEILSIGQDGFVVNRGIADLSPSRYSVDFPAADFVLHRDGEARFDANGNLYDLEWTPTHVRIHRLLASATLQREP